jgi:hypothetical protein
LKQTLVFAVMAVFAIGVIGCSKGSGPVKSVDVGDISVKPSTAGQKGDGKGGNSASAPPVIK